MACTVSVIFSKKKRAMIIKNWSHYRPIAHWLVPFFFYHFWLISLYFIFFLQKNRSPFLLILLIMGTIRKKSYQKSPPLRIHLRDQLRYKDLKWCASIHTTLYQRVKTKASFSHLIKSWTNPNSLFFTSKRRLRLKKAMFLFSFFHGFIGLSVWFFPCLNFRKVLLLFRFLFFVLCFWKEGKKS